LLVVAYADVRNSYLGVRAGAVEMALLRYFNLAAAAPSGPRLAIPVATRTNTGIVMNIGIQRVIDLVAEHAGALDRGFRALRRRDVQPDDMAAASINAVHSDDDDLPPEPVWVELSRSIFP
jgi:hypothetical protein